MLIQNFKNPMLSMEILGKMRAIIQRMTTN